MDHKIPLKEKEVTIDQKPYRYSTPPKDIIERMIKEMFDSDTIRPSSSPFSWPVVLVKKKDHTWRMYVNHRRFNNLTINDKFSIPLVDELLDELHGASIFSKID